MINRMPDFQEDPGRESPRPFLPKRLTREQPQNGLPSGLELDHKERIFFTPSESDDEDKRIFRQTAAEELIPIAEHHKEQLLLAQQIIETEKSKYADRGLCLRFCNDVIFSPIAIPLLIGIGGLGSGLCYIGYIDINTAIEGIRQGSLYETPNPDVRFPALEPTWEICLGLTVMPIAALFIVLEYIHFSFQTKKPRPLTYCLAIVGLPLALGCTALLAFITGGSMSSHSEIGASIQTDTPPWYFLAMTTTALGITCAILMKGIVWLGSWFFEYAPKSSQFSGELEDAGKHILECITTTAETLSVLYAVGRVHTRSQRRQELQTELSNLN